MSTVKHKDTRRRQDVNSKTPDNYFNADFLKDVHYKTQRHPTPKKCPLFNTKVPDANMMATLKHKDTRRRQDVHSEAQRYSTSTRCPL